jgi:hypothetical protein
VNAATETRFQNNYSNGSLLNSDSQSFDYERRQRQVWRLRRCHPSDFRKLSTSVSFRGSFNVALIPSLLSCSKVFEQLEIAYVSSLLKPLKEYPTFRLRQHLFVYGPQGTLKHVMTQTFFGHVIKPCLVTLPSRSKSVIQINLK